MDQDELFIFLVNILKWLYLYEQIKEILACQEKKKKKKKNHICLNLSCILYLPVECTWWELPQFWYMRNNIDKWAM